MTNVFRAPRLVPMALWRCTVVLWSQALSAQAARQGLPDFKTATWVAQREFDMIVSVLELKDGGVLVADLTTPAVHLLGANGQPIRSIGRKGAGPGEFKEPRSVLPHRGDSSLIIDRAQRRMLVLSPAGAVVRTEMLYRHVEASANVLQSDGRGALYFLKSAFSFDSAPGATVPLLRWRVGEQRVDSLDALRPVTTIRRMVNEKDGRPAMFVVRAVDYSPEDDWAIAPDGAIAVVRAQPYRIDWLLANGTRAQGPVQPFTAIPVDASERDEFLGNAVPKTKPPFVASSTFADPFGRVWVRHYAADKATTRRWSVFDRRGLLVTTMELPIRLELVHAGPRGVYAVRRDADDIPSLELHQWRAGR